MNHSKSGRRLNIQNPDMSGFQIPTECIQNELLVKLKKNVIWFFMFAELILRQVSVNIRQDRYADVPSTDGK